MSNELYTIGHSNHSIEKFIKLLELHSIDVVCDVRSAPYSRHNPQFNRETLRQSLKQAKIFCMSFWERNLEHGAMTLPATLMGKCNMIGLLKQTYFNKDFHGYEQEWSRTVLPLCVPKKPHSLATELSWSVIN